MTPLPLRFPVPLVALIAAALVAPFAAAHHSVGYCGPVGPAALGVIEVGAGDPAATYYFDDRGTLGGYVFWIYQEGNGVYGTDLDGDGDVDPHDNLQRGGSGPDSVADPCDDPGPWHPDILIF